MRLLRHYQRGLDRTPASEVKAADDTLVTDIDRASEVIASDILRNDLPGIALLGEEGGWQGEAGSRYVVMLDPLDGTRAFALGAATSTVIIALYDTHVRRLVAVTIGCPATGRIWHAGDRRGVDLAIHPVDDLQGLPHRQSSSLRAPSPGVGGTVLIDNLSSFRRGSPSRTMLTAAGAARLVTVLNTRFAVQSYGSNGLHHALVATSTDGPLGAVTTSMGGAWDAAGVLLVVAAGGYAHSFRVGQRRELEPADCLDPFAYDFLVVSNDAELANLLNTALAEAVLE
jgi:fructose-1,6-bisphosphatase/inositol monophosphatase family enzyme